MKRQKDDIDLTFVAVPLRLFDPKTYKTTTTATPMQRRRRRAQRRKGGKVGRSGPVDRQR